MLICGMEKEGGVLCVIDEEISVMKWLRPGFVLEIIRSNVDDCAVWFTSAYFRSLSVIDWI